MGFLFLYIPEKYKHTKWRHNDVIIFEFAQIADFSEKYAKIEFFA